MSKSIDESDLANDLRKLAERLDKFLQGTSAPSRRMRDAANRTEALEKENKRLRGDLAPI